jgi:hypothetical protein
MKSSFFWDYITVYSTESQPTFRKNMSTLCSGSSSITSDDFQSTTWRHIPEDGTPQWSWNLTVPAWHVLRSCTFHCKNFGDSFIPPTTIDALYAVCTSNLFPCACAVLLSGPLPVNGSNCLHCHTKLLGNSSLHDTSVCQAQNYNLTLIQLASGLRLLQDLFLLLFGLWGYWHCGHSWPIVPASGDSVDDCGEADGM